MLRVSAQELDCPQRLVAMSQDSSVVYCGNRFTSVRVHLIVVAVSASGKVWAAGVDPSGMHSMLPPVHEFYNTPVPI